MVLALLGVALFFLLAMSSRDGVHSPDQLIERLTNEVLAGIRANPKIAAGDLAEIESLVDAVIFPHVDLERDDIADSWPSLAFGDAKTTHGTHCFFSHPTADNLCWRAQRGARRNGSPVTAAGVH